MKKTIRLLCSVLAVCMVLSMLPLQAFAAPLTYKDEYGTWTYKEEKDGTVTLTGFKGSQKNIVVPTQINGRWVRKLGDNLFKNNDELTMVVIPYGITTIGKKVFSGCSRLEKVELPNSLVEIDNNAFADCAVLGELYIPSSVTTLGEKVFDNSPEINVRCTLDSATANYLQDHKDEVAGFTLVEVTPNPNVNNQAGVDNSSSVVTSKGELVTYEFGKLVNGRREYTLVLADSMPDLDLLRYLVADEDQGYQNLNPEIFSIMGNRFQMVSLTRYDGSEVVDITPKGTDGISDVSLDIVLRNDGSENYYDVVYSLFLTGDNISKEAIDQIGFTSQNELTSYRTGSREENTAQVKENSRYVFYYVTEGDQIQYDAEGSVITAENVQEKNAHPVFVTGDCDIITIVKNTAIDNNGQVLSEHETRSIHSTRGSGNIQLSSETTRDASGKVQKNAKYERTENNTIVERRNEKDLYNENGVFVEGHKNVQMPRENGVYIVESKHYWAEKTTTFNNTEVQNGTTVHFEGETTETNRVMYVQEVVRAENATEAEQRIQEQSPNQPSENKYDISERVISSVENHYEEGTRTVGTDDVTTFEGNSSWRILQDHTYIGDTGKYVGWDWEWSSYEVPNNGYSNTYTVSEYRYTSGSEGSEGTWTKTTVTVVSSNSSTNNMNDFKDAYTGDLLGEGYTVKAESFQFDVGLASGADNWNRVDQKEITSETGNKDELAIVQGLTTIEIEGEISISQNDAKKEMLNLEASLKDPENPNHFGNTEKDFDNLIDKIDGEQILSNLENGTIPETNTEDSVDHVHNDDGTTQTVVTPENSATASDAQIDNTANQNTETSVTSQNDGVQGDTPVEE